MNQNQNNPSSDNSLSLRINKFLAQAGVCSRREADKLIEERQITINGKIAQKGAKVSANDLIEVSGKKITSQEKKIYIAFHKPFGVITTTDKKASNNVLDYINIKERIFPIGRLDVESSGLLLFTNDGEIVNKITRAENKHEKEYFVTVDKVINENFLKKMAYGVMIEHQKTLPAKIFKINDYQFRLILIQGLNRQIRKMCQSLGYNVKVLKRIRIMNIHLGDLKRGKWRYLAPDEQKELFQKFRDLK